MLSRFVGSLFLCLVMPTLTACGGSIPSSPPPSGSGADGGINASANNLTACQSYVQTFNNLSCVPAAAKLSTTSACPSSLATNGCNAAPYFDCVRAALRCTLVSGISVVDSSGIQACANQYPCH